MNDPRKKMLSEIVRINRHYQRSIRIDADFGLSDSLNGYICHKTASVVLESMCKQISESRQRAFTWTGPYGGGKSSLAIALASTVCTDPQLRTKAKKLLNTDWISNFDESFHTENGWLVVPVVGKRGNVITEIARSLNKATGTTKDIRKTSGASVIDSLCSAARDSGLDGTLLVIDELGKFLEASAMDSGDDIYFFQELAEAAARSDAKLVVVGILHQSFGQYAARLGNETRDDWAKIQGRFADIPLVAASDEVVELVAKAVESDVQPVWAADPATLVAKAIRSRRPTVGDGIADSLEACWPLHPVMASLLGPISKRQFGQNERSTFGFLSSAEPFGFKDFLQSTKADEANWYLPSDYFDYLKANLEQAILSSSDGHRWAQAVEAVERVDGKTDSHLHHILIKSIAILDLFRDGSGLTAEPEILSSILIGYTKEKVEAALKDLSDWRVALFKKHTGSWSVFEGSDFDIDQAIAQAKAASPGTDFQLLTSLANLYPVIAKRHYHKTGSFRWMNVVLCRLDEVQNAASSFKPKNGEFGAFLLALPSRGVSENLVRQVCADNARISPWPIAIGIPRNHERIDELGSDLLALQEVQKRHELHGDPVARREVFARTIAVKASLEEQLSAALTNADWFTGEVNIDGGLKLPQIASTLADTIYYHAPAIWSELVNRDTLSSNSVKARRDLLYRMLDFENEDHLGISGFPAERGLYETLLRSTGLHRKDTEGVWRFLQPDGDIAATFSPLWEKTRSLFNDASSRVEATALHTLWASTPFGVRLGPMPVIFTAFLLAHKGNVAVYKDGVFIPRITDADIDEYLQDERRFSLRWVTLDAEKKKILEGISKILTRLGASSGSADPLEAARSLVAMVLGLPAWTQRTATLSDIATSIRDTLLKANDPHKVLFVDLAAVLGTADGDEYVHSLEAPLEEMWNAYGAMLAKIESSMLESLDSAQESLEYLRRRAETLSGLTGDLRQDAFSARIAKHDGSRQSIEGILSLAANKPPRDWNDRDIDAALLEVAKFSLRFRQSEALVAVRGRKPKSEAFAVVIGAGAGAQTVAREFDIPERHREKVQMLADELASKLRAKGLKTDVLLAALGRACMQLAQEEEENG